MSESLPKVSVILPVFNTETYVAEAIESILNQSYKNFELIIIDDCSTDDTPLILKEYAEKDNRIRVINNSQNRGPAASRNSGINLSQGDYIALMDADDISRPDRFTKQVDYLDRHKKVYVIGSSVQKMDAGGNRIGEWRLPERDRLIRWHILFRNSRVFCNPTVMMRKDLFSVVTLYDENIYSYDDLDLWTRIFVHDSLLLANLPEILLNYRIHQKSITKSSNDDQVSGGRSIRTRLLSNFLKKHVHPKAIAAYEEFSVIDKVDIPEITKTWFQTYRKYLTVFAVKGRDRLQIMIEILTRSIGYIDIRETTQKIGVQKLRGTLPIIHRLAIIGMCFYSRIRNWHA